MPFSSLQRIVSGGQAGVDRAALLVAKGHSLMTGGFVPKGRLAEDGKIPDGFTDLQETASPDPEERTRLNVALGDATLVLLAGRPDAGTRLTAEIAELLSRPYLELDLRETASAAGLQRAIALVHRFIGDNAVKVLNIAGPRESNCPGIQDRAQRFLEKALAASPVAPGSAVTEPVRLAHLDSGLASLHHWDSVRWLVPFWYLTASGTAAAAMSGLTAGLGLSLAIGLCLAGLAALHLVGRTIAYNDAQIARLRSIGVPLHLHRISAIRFRLAGWRTPATVVFMLLMAAVTTGWLVLAISLAM